MIKKRGFINGCYLLVFLLVTLGVHFLHTETDLGGQNNCPACHFQNSTLTTAQTPVFQPPQLVLLEILKSFDTLILKDIDPLSPSSRSPPSA